MLTTILGQKRESKPWGCQCKPRAPDTTAPQAKLGSSASGFSTSWLMTGTKLILALYQICSYKLGWFI